MADQKLKVIIRVMPSADEIDAALPAKATASQIIKKLLSDTNLKLPKADPQGNPITYNLRWKEGGKDLGQNESLEKAGVKDNDTLLLTPNIIAG
ncbi:MAG: hypothetical protein JSV88_21385 [Candidatus Aminicenantes bacterium]|nr:MAG: hypothetical protein JSV88_21385 [Candidatus Aminicenantes bacterium]